MTAAWYDGDGKLLGTDLVEKPRGSLAQGTIPVKDGADHYRLFALDEDSAPILESLNCTR